MLARADLILTWSTLHLGVPIINLANIISDIRVFINVNLFINVEI